MGRKSMSERRRQRRHYLKVMKKSIGKELNGEIFTTKEFEMMKRSFREEGKNLRINDLREKLEEEKDTLAEQEKALRDQLKGQGKKKKEIDAHIESWMDKQKIWALHNDVYDQLV
jgi:DNA replicative helicase MCM subunit Mcm2 (Cdc46/Mcm family)